MEKISIVEILFKIKYRANKSKVRVKVAKFVLQNMRFVTVNISLNEQGEEVLKKIFSIYKDKGFQKENVRKSINEELAKHRIEWDKMDCLLNEVYHG